MLKQLENGLYRDGEEEAKDSGGQSRREKMDICKRHLMQFVEAKDGDYFMSLPKIKPIEGTYTGDQELSDPPRPMLIFLKGPQSLNPNKTDNQIVHLFKTIEQIHLTVPR